MGSPQRACLSHRTTNLHGFHRRRSRERRQRTLVVGAGCARIAPSFRKAVITAEDLSFFSHNGFDSHEVRAALEEALAGGRVRGASTITQQLAKNLWLSPSRNPIRKTARAIAHAIAGKAPEQAPDSGALSERCGVRPLDLPALKLLRNGTSASPRVASHKTKRHSSQRACQRRPGILGQLAIATKRIFAACERGCSSSIGSTSWFSSQRLLHHFPNVLGVLCRPTWSARLSEQYALA